MKKILAVFDGDHLYAQRLTDYLNQKKKFPFQVIQFTNENALKSYAEEHVISVLLISTDVMNEEIRQWNIGTIVYLTNMEEQNEWDSCRTVYKYQSAENVVKELFSCYDALFPVGYMEPIWQEDSKIIGIYAPYGENRNTVFSFLFGVILAERYRVLYLNMEGFSGFTKMFCQDFLYDLSDILYYESLEDRHWKDKKELFIQEYKGMKWIPPVCYPEDREYLTKEMIEKILKELLKSKEFDRIVINIADHFFFASTILDLCHEIYIPIQDDVISGWKMSEFEEWMERSGRHDTKKKIKKIQLPCDDIRKGAEMSLEQLMYGTMADYVRNLIRGTGNEELER